MEDSTTQPELGTPAVSRRDMLRRSALVGGALVWTAPAVQTLAAPAFAAAGSDTPGEDQPEGAISYVIVFFKCGGTYYRVKYTGTDPGYTIACGDNAARGNVSSDEAGIGYTHYDNILTDLGLNDSSFSDDCPTGVAPTTLSNGNLQLSLDGCQIIGWLLHDGSCAAKANGETKFRYDSGSRELDTQNSGPDVPTSNVGVFVFDDCEV